MGEQFLGVSLDGAHRFVRECLSRYLERFSEHQRDGHGLAFVGGQGTGKTACLALLAQAVATYTPEPRRTQFDTRHHHRVLYIRMPWLSRWLSDYQPAGELEAWRRHYEEMRDARVLLLDEAQLVDQGDRGGSLLVDMIDERVSRRLVTHLALNAKWDDLRRDTSVLLRQVREKLETVTLEVVIPGASRRKGWEL